MSLPRRIAPWLMGAALVACSGNPPTTGPAPSPPAPIVATAPTGPATRGPDKPTAPIDLTLEARPVAGTATVERFEVVMNATPRRDLDRVELAIDGQPATVATATAGALGVARATVEVPRGEGRDVVGTAVVVVDGKRMGRAAQVRIGAPAAAAPAGTIIHLPDGTAVQEVRP